MEGAQGELPGAAHQLPSSVEYFLGVAARGGSNKQTVNPGLRGAGCYQSKELKFPVWP